MDEESESSWNAQFIETPRAELLLELNRKLYEMPEYKLWLELAAFDNSIYIFVRNFDAFKNIINLITTNKKLKFLFFPRNRDKFFQLFKK